MANQDMPRGFRPVGNLNGSPYNGATVKAVLLAADATATFIGDLVKLSGTASSDGFGYPSIAQGAAADTSFFGVVTSFDANPDNLSQQYRPASQLRIANVVPITGGQLFVVQSSGSSAITDVGNTADVTVGSGSTTTGLSAMELDSSDIGTGVNLQIMALDPRPDNEFGTNSDLIVRVNEHFAGGDGTAA